MGFFKQKNKEKKVGETFSTSLNKNKSSSPQSADTAAQMSLRSSLSFSSPESGKEAKTATPMSSRLSLSSPSTECDKKKGITSTGKPQLPNVKTDSTISSRSADSPPGTVTNKDEWPSIAQFLSQYPSTIEMIPDLILNFEADIHSLKVNYALRALVSLSEENDCHNCEKIVFADNGRLVPALLSFLRHCGCGSPNQYLALLLLNNLSIPAENKRVIAIEYRATHILGRLLCADPSCHFIAIILVNLTSADVNLRVKLVEPGPIELVDALAFTLRIAASSPEDSATHSAIPTQLSGEEFSPKSLLINALNASFLYTVASSSPPAITPSLTNDGAHQISFNPNVQIFPETARWCLCALKNLTVPSHNIYAATAIIGCGIMPLIFRIITPIALINDPKSCDVDSLKDPALSIVLNMSMVAAARPYLRKENAIQILSIIADQLNDRDDSIIDPDGKAIQNLRCLKSRMALSFLVGSEGYYGQPRPSGRLSYRHPDETTIMLMASESNLLLELLSDVLHHPEKQGPGGYSAESFTVKGILYSIRCLLTSDMNQNTIAITSGTCLNILLLKAIAYHTFLDLPTVDADTAEYACFSLYLLSSFGFKNPFLPKEFSQDKFLEKVLISYLNSMIITPAGKHAAEQILLRVSYLVFENDPECIAIWNNLNPNNFEFDMKLKQIVGQVILEDLWSINSGAQPLEMIFSRPILRSRIPKTNIESPWDKASIKVFPSGKICMHG
uniref:Uncharacterized protein n=2 Tax=Corethron hystrix TaxID=216773 RepID=A0A7S1BNT1_9STRA|mmetsp:Transcript_33083/g.76242  ORF Transcript_33083/g.76242 Transcript_33083/m.76242 type:complete len:732 (+) Transcript_33083:475-2670(+)